MPALGAVEHISFDLTLMKVRILKFVRRDQWLPLREMDVSRSRVGRERETILLRVVRYVGKGFRGC